MPLFDTLLGLFSKPEFRNSTIINSVPISSSHVVINTETEADGAASHDHHNEPPRESSHPHSTEEGNHPHSATPASNRSSHRQRSRSNHSHSVQRRASRSRQASGGRQQHHNRSRRGGQSASRQGHTRRVSRRWSNHPEEQKNSKNGRNSGSGSHLSVKDPISKTITSAKHAANLVQKRAHAKQNIAGTHEHESAGFHVGARENDSVSASPTGITGQERASLGASTHAKFSARDGNTSVGGSTSAFGGLQENLNGFFGLSGAGINGGAFGGGKVSAGAHVKHDGVGVGDKASADWGAGATGGVDAGIHNGHIDLSAHLNAALGPGIGDKIRVSVDPKKVLQSAKNQVESQAKSVVDFPSQLYHHPIGTIAHELNPVSHLPLSLPGIPTPHIPLPHIPLPHISLPSL